jgi:biopolymer transport protein TolR
MSWLGTNYLARTKPTVWSVAFVVVVTMMLAAPRITAQAMQKGVNVELAPASSAVPVPDADSQDAVVIAVTDTGKLYFGIEPVTPGSLTEKLKDRVSDRTVYIKADARAPYAYLVKVLDAARTAGIAGVTLLTTQPRTQAGTVLLPEGFEMDLAPLSPAVTK